jgi:hypothetical protein
MLKSASLLAALATAALIATPALAAKHKFSCYDFAWESQDQKDCLAHPEKAHAMPMHKGVHKAMAKGAKMKGAKDMKMKDMPAKKDMPEKKS